ncbi:MAG TPA: hypothetical protein PLU50_02175 [Pseudobdellovibrionaceae bacterium]|nr:hypothetical protein [Pseudobdellovibrionaceae bacterium]
MNVLELELKSFVRKALLLMLLFFPHLAPIHAQAQTPEMIKKKEAEIRSEMESISKQLGVSCEQCHKISNFKDGTKKEFHVSQEHMKILQVLKQSGFDGVRGPEANCYLCHRGKLMPDYKTSSESKAP